MKYTPTEPADWPETTYAARWQAKSITRYFISVRFATSFHTEFFQKSFHDIFRIFFKHFLVFNLKGS